MDVGEDAREVGNFGTGAGEQVATATSSNTVGKISVEVAEGIVHKSNGRHILINDLEVESKPATQGVNGVKGKPERTFGEGLFVSDDFGVGHRQ